MLFDNVLNMNLEEISSPQFVDVPQGNFKEELYNSNELWSSDIFSENPRRKQRKIALTNERIERVHGYFQMGQAGQKWYEGMLDDLIKIFGNEDDALLFISMLSATSPNNKVESNTYYAMKGYAFCKLNKKIPRYKERKRNDIFNGFSDSHYDNVIRACLREELSGPKVSAFVKAMLGDLRAVVIDRWMIRALGFKAQFNSNAASIKLDNGCKIKGRIKKYRNGYIVRLKENSNIICKTEEFGLLDFMASLESRKIKQRGENEFFVPEIRLRNLPKFPEKTLSENQYNRFVEAVTRVADMMAVPPRDYQAAVWTGIKIEQDPVGLENFLFFYHKHYGDDPPNMEMLERIVESPGFHPRFAEPTLFENPPELPETEESWVLQQTASMLD